MNSLPARLCPGRLESCGVGSAGHAVVGVELGLDLADVPQQLVEHSVSVGPVAGVDATHPLCRVAVHLHCTVAMGTKGLEAQMASDIFNVIQEYVLPYNPILGLFLF